MRIILVRHGQTEWNRLGRFQGRSDIPLNKKGKAEALELAEALKKETISALYSSPLTRAKETAQSIRAFHPRASFNIENRLIEKDRLDVVDPRGVPNDFFTDMDLSSYPQSAKYLCYFLQRTVGTPSTEIISVYSDEERALIDEGKAWIG